MLISEHYTASTTWLFCCVKGIALVTVKETELIQYGSAVGEIRASFNEF